MPRVSIRFLIVITAAACFIHGPALATNRDGTAAGTLGFCNVQGRLGGPTANSLAIISGGIFATLQHPEAMQ